MGWLIFRELKDQLCQIGFIRQDAARFQGTIELDLIGSHRFYFDDLFCGIALKQVCDNPVCFICIAGPMHVSAGTDHVLFKLQKITIEMTHSVRFNFTRGLPKCLPVRHFVDDSGALGTNGVCSISKISA